MLGKLTVRVLDRYHPDLRQRGGVGGRPMAPGTVRKIHLTIRRHSIWQVRRLSLGRPQVFLLPSTA